MITSRKTEQSAGKKNKQKDPDTRPRKACAGHRGAGGQGTTAGELSRKKYNKIQSLVLHQELKQETLKR